MLPPPIPLPFPLCELAAIAAAVELRLTLGNEAFSALFACPRPPWLSEQKPYRLVESYTGGENELATLPIEIQGRHVQVLIGENVITDPTRSDA
jgi:hypothetical protein